MTGTLRRTISVRDRIRARLAQYHRKPPITPDQKLQARIETLTVQAHDLHAECSVLQSKTKKFHIRSKTTLPPTAPPERSALFERDPKAPPSQYDAHMKAYEMMLAEWREFEKEVRAFGPKFERFVGVVEKVKKDAGCEPGKPMGRIEHQFEGLDNAIFKVKNQRVDLSREVAAVPLPAEKGEKGEKGEK